MGMTAITEDYVSFKTAKHLEEKGFDCDTLLMYSEKGERYFINDLIYPSPFGDSAMDNMDYIHCPTLQMTIKWLREIHNISVEPISAHYYNEETEHYEIRFKSEVFLIPQNPDKENWSDVYHTDCLKSYEEACETAINYCLTNLL